MEDDDAAGSASPSPTSSPLPTAVALPVAEPVTVAAPPGHVLTLALPIQKPTAGREDAWSEGATSALIDAWGERFKALGRGSLRHPQWQEVADVVSSRDGYSKPPKSDVQCKNRIDTLKKKYKVEKAKPSSQWPFFQRLDSLLAPIYKPGGDAAGNAASNTGARRSAPAALRVNFPQRSRTPLLPAAVPAAGVKRKPSSPPQPSASLESSDGFPPEPMAAANGKRTRVEAARNGAAGGRSVRELAQAIRRFGEAYERVESAKLEQAAALERQHLEYARELEAQRMQFFIKTQMELSQVNNRTPSIAPAATGAASSSGGGSARRMALAADAGASSSHQVQYRVRDGGHHHAPRPRYQYFQNNAAAAAATDAGNAGDTDNDDEEEDVEEESQ